MASRDRWRMEPRDGPPPRAPRPRSFAPSRPAGGPPRYRSTFPRRFSRPEGFAVGPGFPWPVVSVAAAVVAVLLAWLTLDLGGIGGLLFPAGFAAICVVAVCAARADQVYVPSVQPPFVAMLAVVGAAVLTGRTTSTTTFLLSVLAPLARLFWWLLLVCVVCVVLGLVRSGRLPGRLPGSAAWSWRGEGR